MPTGAARSPVLAMRAGVIAAATLVSRLLGVAREAVIAWAFPAALIDLWVVAFTIPNTLRGLLAEGAASAAVLPTYSELRAKSGDLEARQFFARVMGAMLIVLGVVTLVGVACAPLLVTAFASGYLDDPQRFADTVTLSRIVFPYIFFMGIAAISAAVLNAHRHFAVPALAPALLNVALIAAPFGLTGATIALGLPAIAALGAGALIGGALQVIAQWPSLRRVGLFVWPRLELGDPLVRRAARLLVPVAAGLGVYQINLMLSRTLASWLPEGAQTYLWFGQRLVEVPQGMFAVAIATAALPALAELHARGEVDELKRTFREALRTSIFIALPASVILIALAEPLVAVLFQRGQFGRAEVIETARSLALQAAGVWAIASVRVVVPMFHARGDTRTPVIASTINLAVFAATGVALMGWLGHAGIAAAISAAGIAQLGILLVLLRRAIGPLGAREVLTSAARVALATGAMALAAITIASWGEWARGAIASNVLVLVVALSAGGAAYLITAAAARSPELSVLTAVVRRRLRRAER